mmetsp:Transcript_13858/g.15175  ORF Transcript_13858/g.15175 Transcript_13858/m.15175 type:complete len:120 (+) Transcript_13858:223-582(+)
MDPLVLEHAIKKQATTKRQTEKEKQQTFGVVVLVLEILCQVVAKQATNPSTQPPPHDGHRVAAVIVAKENDVPKRWSNLMIHPFNLSDNIYPTGSCADLPKLFCTEEELDEQIFDHFHG